MNSDAGSVAEVEVSGWALTRTARRGRALGGGAAGPARRGRRNGARGSGSAAGAMEAIGEDGCAVAPLAPPLFRGWMAGRRRTCANSCLVNTVCLSPKETQSNPMSSALLRNEAFAFSSLPTDGNDPDKRNEYVFFPDAFSEFLNASSSEPSEEKDVIFHQKLPSNLFIPDASRTHSQHLLFQSV
jgi:hypothetical protein